MKKGLLCALVLLPLIVAGCSSEENEPDQFTDRPETPLEVAGKTTFELMVIGDFGTGSDDEHAVADAMLDWHKEFGADAIVTTGDNVYPGGDPTDFDRTWFEPFGWVDEEGLDVVASLGNHDVITDGGAPVMDLFDMPAPYYETTVGDVDIFVLDANGIADPPQTSWLRRRLATSDNEWQIVVFHQPAYSCSRHGSTQEVIDTWVPLFRRFGVDLVLNGHDHLYQRFAAEGGVTYVVTGGGGTFLDGTGDCPATTPERLAAVDDKHHFVAIEGSATQLVGRVVGIDEASLDEFTLVPNP
jgi:Calcineurin-like phosphoesterase